MEVRELSSSNTCDDLDDASWRSEDADKDLSSPRVPEPLAENSEPEVVAQRNNIKLVVRVRPFLPATSSSLHGPLKLAPAFEVVSDRHIVVAPRLNREFSPACGNSPRAFVFDAVLGPETSQEDVFQRCGAELVGNTLEGFNGCLFAYGQTGSGKTFTLYGGGVEADASKNAGLVPRFVRALYKTAAECGREIEVAASFLEIHNERLRDLFAPIVTEDSSVVELQVVQVPKIGASVHGLRRLTFGCAEELLRLLDIALTRRATGATQVNSRSSRSHAVLTIYTTSKSAERTVRPGQAEEEGSTGASPTPVDTLVSTAAVLNLVDLAGSERAKKSATIGIQRVEGIHINTSLMVLGQVISALAAGPKEGRHPPYRQSRLTYLLQSSLAGNSKTILIAAVSPARCDVEETLSTLRFASSAARVRTRAEANLFVDINMADMMRRLAPPPTRLALALGDGKPRGRSPGTLPQAPLPHRSRAATPSWGVAESECQQGVDPTTLALLESTNMLPRAFRAHFAEASRLLTEAGEPLTAPTGTKMSSSNDCLLSGESVAGGPDTSCKLCALVPLATVGGNSPGVTSPTSLGGKVVAISAPVEVAVWVRPQAADGGEIWSLKKLRHEVRSAQRVSSAASASLVGSFATPSLPASATDSVEGNSSSSATSRCHSNVAATALGDYFDASFGSGRLAVRRAVRAAKAEVWRNAAMCLRAAKLGGNRGKGRGGPGLLCSELESSDSGEDDQCHAEARKAAAARAELLVAMAQFDALQDWFDLQANHAEAAFAATQVAVEAWRPSPPQTTSCPGSLNVAPGKPTHQNQHLRGGLAELSEVAAAAMAGSTGSAEVAAAAAADAAASTPPRAGQASKPTVADISPSFGLVTPPSFSVALQPPSLSPVAYVAPQLVDKMPSAVGACSGCQRAANLSVARRHQARASAIGPVGATSFPSGENSQPGPQVAQSAPPQINSVEGGCERSVPGGHSCVGVMLPVRRVLVAQPSGSVTATQARASLQRASLANTPTGATSTVPAMTPRSPKSENRGGCGHQYNKILWSAANRPRALWRQSAQAHQLVG